ncbi:MAG: arginine--tRNA ligase [Chloroflexota bacterium]|nr:MAG: arginine--tRNA ligase [Chloroflexota bacterium]
MIRDQIKQVIEQALAAAQADGQLPEIEQPAIEVLRPKQAGHGDYSTNVAMVAAAALRKSGASSNPRAIAEIIAAHIPADGLVGRVEIAGPGFINIHLSERWLQQQVNAIVAAGDAFGAIDIGRGAYWQVEYLSANPTGPVHYGGARNAVLGDSLANVLEAAGYRVQREFYVNDAGNQFNIFAATLYARYAQLLGRDEAIPEDGYAGEYMIGYAQTIVERCGDRFLHMDRNAAIGELKELSKELVLASLQSEVSKLGIRYDRWFSEQSLYDSGLVYEVLDKLRARGDIGERDGATWFLASKYPKVDKDEVVIRSNGMPTYFASDIAYHYDKFVVRGFDHVVNIWGVDHQGHVPRMAAVMAALGLDPSRLTIVLHGLVKLIRNGEEVKLSKRRGALITIGDVVDEVGADAVRFNLLTRGPESTIEFDLDLAAQASWDNPVCYVQYSHARICSLLSNAESKGLNLQPESDLSSLLTHEVEIALIKKILELEEQIELAVEKLSPHNLTHYATDLAKAFNAFYRDCRVVDSAEPTLSAARLQLSQAARIGLKNTLTLLGISAPESM